MHISLEPFGVLVAMTMSILCSFWLLVVALSMDAHELHHDIHEIQSLDATVDCSAHPGAPEWSL